MHMMQRRTVLRAAPIHLAPKPSRAQIYPAKPIRYIVPVAAGGGSDMVGRTVTERWGRVLGQTFVVDNQGGGGGVIASQNTAKAAPDGSTLMQGRLQPRTRQHRAQRELRDITINSVQP